MGRRRHDAAIHHVLSRAQAELGHGEVLGTQFLALSAQGAAVDEVVGQVQAFDDGRIVVHLAGVDAGIALVFLQIDAGLHADQTLALQAAPGLLPGLRLGIGFRDGQDPLHRCDAVQLGVQAAFVGIAGRGQGHTGHQAFQGPGRAPALPCLPRRGRETVARGRDAGPASAADIVPPVQDLRIHAGFGGRQLRQGTGIQQDAVVLSGSLSQAGRIRHGLLEAHAPAAQGLPFGIQGPGPGQCRPAGKQLRLGLAFMEDGHRVALAGQIPGADQTGQSGADDGDTLLFARHGQGTGLDAQMLRTEDLQPVQVDGAPQVAAQAALFAGMVADTGHQARQGQITFQLFAGIAPAAFGGMAQEGARIQPQRAQGLATGRALLRAAGFHFMQRALAVHGNAHGDLGMPAGRGPASSCPMRRQATDTAHGTPAAGREEKTVQGKTASLQQDAVSLVCI